MSEFPMFRLGTLLVRQLSSPIASRIKEYARNHPGVGRRVCMRVAQTFRVAELRFRLWSLQLRQPAAVPALSDRAALDAGADILGEIIIFTLGCAIIIFEVNRQAEKQEVKVLAEKSRWVAVRLQLEELREELAFQQSELERLHAALGLLARDRDH